VSHGTRLNVTDAGKSSLAIQRRHYLTVHISPQRIVGHRMTSQLKDNITTGFPFERGFTVKMVLEVEDY
jgi:hypothetical protein